MSEFINSLDRTILLWVHSHHSDVLTAIMLGTSYAGEAAACWWTLGIVFVVRRQTRAKEMMIAFIASLIVGMAFTTLPQTLWFRDRPYVYLEGIHQLGVKWETSAFPSGHTVTSFAAATVFGMAGPRLRLSLFLFAILMGISRVYAGMHHPSDVLWGAGAGVLTGWVSWRLVLRVFGVSQTSQTSQTGQTGLTSQTDNDRIG